MSAARPRSADGHSGWRHLAIRFFEVIRARGLTDSEHSEVANLLGHGLADLFFDQRPADQRHGLDSARYVQAKQPQRSDLVLAALLHDIGKRHARLGVPGRVLASVLIRAKAPLPPSFRVYRDHGPGAADELAALGAPQIVVDFARDHHGQRPAGFNPEDWRVLMESDQPAKTLETHGAEISSDRT